MVLTILIALVLVVPRPSWAVTEPVPISVGPQKSVMAESFKSGRLPAALPIPSGNPDAAIKALAGQIAAKDKNSTASLLTAMQLAGYTIRGDAGRKVVAPARGKRQDIALTTWEMATTAKMFGEGWTLAVSTQSPLSSMPDS
jgi:hypothetical protein